MSFARLAFSLACARAFSGCRLLSVFFELFSFSLSFLSFFISLFFSFSFYVFRFALSLSNCLCFSPNSSFCSYVFMLRPHGCVQVCLAYLSADLERVVKVLSLHAHARDVKFQHRHKENPEEKECTSKNGD